MKLNRSRNWPRAVTYREARELSPSPRPIDGKDRALKNWRRWRKAEKQP